MKLITEAELIEDDAVFEVNEYAPLGKDGWDLLRPYIGMPTEKPFWYRYTIPLYLYRQLMDIMMALPDGNQNKSG